MKIRILSDLHLEFQDWTPSFVDCDLVVLAGDIHNKQHGVTWAKEHFTCPVVYVPGNHEFYGSNLPRTVRKLKETAQGSNVHVLHNDVFVMGDLRILGTTLWTNYRLTGNQPLAMWDAQQTITDFKKIRTAQFQKILPKDILMEHSLARQFLEENLAVPFDGQTLVVTHHAPCEMSLAPRYREQNTHLNAAYASPLEFLMGAAGCTLWAHGHTHDSAEYEVGGTRVICNPRGYAPKHLNKDFKPDLVVTL